MKVRPNNQVQSTQPGGNGNGRGHGASLRLLGELICRLDDAPEKAVTAKPRTLHPPGARHAEHPGPAAIAPACAKVLVIDEHPMVGEWIAGVLSDEAEIIRPGHPPALDALCALPDLDWAALLILEIAHDIRRGLDAIAALRADFPELRILVFSGCDEIRHSTAVIRAGANGFVSKTAVRDEFLQAVRHVMLGGLHLGTAMIRHLSEKAPGRSGQASTAPEAVLSPREFEVFELVGEGLRPTEIGQRMSLSVKTIESYTARIREKLHFRGSRELFQAAVKWSKTRE